MISLGHLTTASSPTPTRHCAHPHVSERRRGGVENEKLSVLSVYRLYQVGRFLSTWRCRVQSGGNNTFECSAEWATIAVVCKQCGPGLGSGHRTQLPRLQPPAPVRRALRLYLWHTCHSHTFIHTQRPSKHFISSERFSPEVFDVVLIVRSWTQSHQSTSWDQEISLERFCRSQGKNTYRMTLGAINILEQFQNQLYQVQLQSEGLDK